MKRSGRQAVGRTAQSLGLVAALLSASPPDRLTAQCPDGSPPPCRAQPTRAATTPASNSVAVLYFDNLSPDTADAYLADGLTEEITSRLGGIQRLQIKRPSRDAVRRLRDTVPDYLVTVGRVLRVRYLVEGSVRRAGERVRVSVRLLNATDGFRVWGDDYDRATADLLALQEEIARQVATGIAGRLAPAERASLAVRPTLNPQAYERFLRGNYYLAQRNPRALLRATEEYRAAVQLDPGFTRALARIAYGNALLLLHGRDYVGVSRESLLARGSAAAEHALRQDPNSSDAWLAHAFLLTFGHPQTYEGVRSAFERSIALDRRNAEAYHQYGSVLLLLGDDSAAASTYHQALAIEPERAITLTELGLPSMFGRRFGEARSWFDSALVVDPGLDLGRSFRTLARLELGDTAGARADALRIGSEGLLAMVEVQEGDTLGARTRVERWLRQTRISDTLSSVHALSLSLPLLAVGDRDRALEILERVQPPGPRLRWLLRWPELDPLRSHPRFQRLVEESRPPGVPR